MRHGAAVCERNGDAKILKKQQLSRGNRDADLDRQIARRIALMPLLPGVVSELMALSPEAPDYLDQVHALAAMDPTLAVRIIEYAGRTIRVREGRETLDLRYAIARLGARKTANLIVAMSMVDVFPVKTDHERMLWVHSLQVAVISRWLTAIIGRSWAELAYLAGLLHDIGRFVVFQSAPDVNALIGDAAFESPDSSITAEFDIIGTDHVAVGVQACTAWGIPDSITRIVQLHHSHELAWDTPELSLVARRVAITQIADGLSMLLMAADWAQAKPNEHEEATRLYELCAQEVLRIVDFGYSGIGGNYQQTLVGRIPALLGIVRAETQRLIRGLQL